MPENLQNHPKGAPGSPLALENGCTCAVIDNGRGRGMYVDSDGVAIYVVMMDCPVHNNEEGTLSIPLNFNP